jgi:hypothetical protein
MSNEMSNVEANDKNQMKKRFRPAFGFVLRHSSFVICSPRIGTTLAENAPSLRKILICVDR